jgi:pimeloyl-ACP methyl ester carboxylesterase
MQRLHRERDVVLVDQRGTGGSNPLGCNLFGDKPDMQSWFAAYPLDKLSICREQLEKVANLKLYTTSIAMDDLDEVRSALGYQRINLYGGSYGSTAALVYLRQHPDHVRTVTIFGVAPPNAKIPLSFAKGTQHAIDRLLDDCAADTKAAV